MTLRQTCLVLLSLGLSACGEESGADPDRTTAAHTPVALAELEIPESWGVFSSSDTSASALIRLREDGDDVRRAGFHRDRVVVTRPYEQFPPGPRESREVEQLEDDLCELLEPGNQALLWQVRTGADRKLWLFYAASTDEAVGRLERARELISTRGASMSVERDPEWSTYHEFTFHEFTSHEFTPK